MNLLIKYNKIYNLEIKNNVSIRELKVKLCNLLNINDFTILFKNKILTCHENTNIFKNNDMIYIIPKLKGGFSFKKILNGILNSIFRVLNPITGPFKDIIMVLVTMGELLYEITLLFIKIIEAIPTVFKPDKLIDDVIYGLIRAINGVFKTLIDSLDIDSARGKKKDETGKGAFGVTSESKHVCVAPTMVNLIILVLCPPLQLFLYKGMKGIILVIICALLTYYCYYFPGLIFAALHVLC